MIVRRPSSHLTTSSTSSASSTGWSLKPPSVLSNDSYSGNDEDEDDEEKMSNDEYIPTRPLSVAIPSVGAHGPYCPRRPSLREILANTSPPPWTLAAFMAYLSNNHCLETLEFTMDAGRYKKHYAKMMSRASGTALPPAKDREYVQALWHRLVEAYIQPSGSREVNLPSSVKNPIIHLSPSALPPSPEILDPAVTKIYELMEDSVLVPFLNSVYPQTAHPTVSSCPFITSDNSNSTSSRAFDDQAIYSRRTTFRNSPPPQSAVHPHSNTYSVPPLHFRQSAPVGLSGGTSSHLRRFSVKLSQSTSSPANLIDTSEIGLGNSAPGISDDSGSTGSPSTESPSTPPFSDQSIHDSSNNKRDSGMWKKLGRLSGMKPIRKKSYGGFKADDE